MAGLPMTNMQRELDEMGFRSQEPSVRNPNLREGWSCELECSWEVCGNSCALPLAALPQVCPACG